MLNERPILHPRSVALHFKEPLRREIVRASTYAEALSIAAPGGEFQLDQRVRQTFTRLVLPGPKAVLRNLETRDIRAALWCCACLFPIAAKPRYRFHRIVRKATLAFASGEREKAEAILKDEGLLDFDEDDEDVTELDPNSKLPRSFKIHERLHGVLVNEILSPGKRHPQYPLCLSYTFVDLFNGVKSPSKANPAGTGMPDMYDELHKAVMSLPDVVFKKPTLPRPASEYIVDPNKVEWKE